MKFFSSFFPAYIFFFILLKGLDDSQPFLGHVFSSLQYHVHAPSQERYAKQKAVVVV